MKVNDGRNKQISVMYCDGTKVSQWYIYLINAEGYTGVALTDTPASHAGWSELTGYASATRPAFVPGTPAGGLLTGSAADFVATTNIRIKGYGLVSSSTKGGTTGIFDQIVLLSQVVEKATGESFKIIPKLRCAGN
jgi:hypothetical protein